MKNKCDRHDNKKAICPYCGYECVFEAYNEGNNYIDFTVINKCCHLVEEHEEICDESTYVTFEQIERTTKDVLITEIFYTPLSKNKKE